MQLSTNRFCLLVTADGDKNAAYDGYKTGALVRIWAKPHGKALLHRLKESGNRDSKYQDVYWREYRPKHRNYNL
jgi:hypothetical protein